MPSSTPAPRSDALKAAQARYEEKRNARKLLLRLTPELADALDAYRGETTREMAVREILEQALAGAGKRKGKR